MTAPATFSRPIAGGPSAAGMARDLVNALPLGLEHARQVDMRLAISELVTNSVLHGEADAAATIDLSFTVSRESVRCTVTDDGPGFRPSDQPGPGPGRIGGQGLVIIAGLATAWGTERDGRRVWFELARDQ